MDAQRSGEKIEQELDVLRGRVSELEAAGTGHRRNEEYGQTDNYFRLLVENAYDAILVLNRDGTLRYLSPSVKRITGYEPHELLGRDPFELVHPEDVQGLLNLFTEGITEPGRTEHAEYRSRHKDGSWRIIEAVGKNLLEEPDVEGIVVNLRDITGYRRIEQVLRESEERYRHLIENLNDVVYTVDKQGVLTYMSPVIERASGYKAEELVGQAFTRFVYPDDLPGLLRSFERTIAGELEPYEFRVIDKDGGIRYVQTSSRPLEEDGETAGLIGIISEITVRKQAEEARRRTEEHFRGVIRQQIRYYRGSQ